MFGMRLQNVFIQQWSEVRYGVTKCVYSTVVRGPVWGYKMCFLNSSPMFGMRLQNVFIQQWSEVRYGVTKCVFLTVVRCSV